MTRSHDRVHSAAARPRVLVIAESANPEWASVPRVGWALWRALATVADVHAVTHVRNRENILRAGISPDEFTALDTGRFDRITDRAFRLMHGKDGGVGWTTLSALSVLPYYDFERQLWRRFGDRIRRGEFDVVHRLTPLSPTVPSTLAAKCARAGVPFVIGPLNGGLPWPKHFAYARRREHEWLTYVREAYRLLPGYRGTRRFASAIICGSADTRAQIADRYKPLTVYVPENAIDPARFPLQDRAPVRGPLRAVFVGRFTRYKGCDMLVEAAAPLVREGLVELTLIGDGPQRAELAQLAEREALPRSMFTGWIDHAELHARLARCHVFAFPSVREFGGAVVLEAMALGLMPIVMAYGGPGELVTDNTGIRLPMGTRAEIVARLRATLARLANDPSEIVAKGRLGSERVSRYFTWEAKAAQVLEVYRWALGARGKPDFGMPFPDPEHDCALHSASPPPRRPAPQAGSRLAPLSTNSQ